MKKRFKDYINKKAILKSGLFDEKYYLLTYPDVRKADIDPLKHFIKSGWKEGRNPNPNFDTKYYLENNPDVKESEINPLSHYIRFGAKEGRTVNSANKLIDKYTSNNKQNIIIKFARVLKIIIKEPTLVFKFFKSVFQDGLAVSIEKIKIKSTNGYYEPTLIFLNNINLEKYNQELEKIEFAPKVSVIVPNYNHAKFLNMRIDSILNQTYRNFEILLLDDCSTDNSRDILLDYEKKYPSLIKTIFNTTNAGNVFKQWEKGIQSAKGELVWICESDDFCENDFLEKIVNHFRNPAVNIAFGRIQFSDINGKFQKGLDSYREGAERGIWNKSIIRPAKKWFCNAFGVNNVIANVGGCVFKKQNLSKDIWEEARTYKILGDWYLYSHLANGGLIAYEPDAISYFRQHEKNTSVTSFSTAKYYEEHFALMKNLKNMWDIPDETIDNFYSKIEFQYNHFKCEKTLGSLKNYVNIEELKSIKREKKHILIAILAFHPGGGEFFPINLANAIQNEEDTQVSLFVLNMNVINKDMYSLVDKRIAIYDSKFVTAYGVNRFLEDAGISLINSHMVSLDVYFTVRHKVNIPYYPTLHGSYEACNVQQNVIKDISEKVTHWIYTADRNLTAIEFLNIPKNKITKLSNAMPIDDEPFPKTRKELGIKDDTVVFILVARGIKRKGWRASIEAFIKLNKENQNTHLLLVGEGEEVDNHKVKYQNEKNITFLGFQSKIHGLLKLSDCLLLPTRFAGESYPLIVIQALQVGLPVISVDTGEIKSMMTLEDGIAGVLLENKRDTRQFIDSLYIAMKDMVIEKNRIYYSGVAEQLAKKYDISELTKKYLNIFNNKKTIYLHIGIGKTGTSSIQDMLVRNYDLFLKQDVLVPKSGIKYGMAHHGLANLAEEDFSLETKENYEDLIKEIDESNAKTVIISSELFSYVKPRYIEQIHQYLNKYDVKIVFYVREQVKLFESTYLQWLKVGNKNLKDPISFFHGHKQAWDFNQVIKAWEDIFNVTNIQARLFDKNINNGDICKDFLKFLHLDRIYVDYPKEYANESIIPDFTEFIIELDTLKATDFQRKEIMNEILLLSNKFKSVSSSKSINNSEFYSNLREYYKDSNSIFASKYLSDIEKKLLTEAKL
ncbi:hypothetical protein DF188_05825 [Aliarcobacter skirrowii]|uniref:Glycosyltransferase n=1 Tax=Aliarcobacter skirrowii TaxID=28200 RepID=A0A2U2C184_9BACT|nr:glycosyltransferase [Aliarcobacter skirrowii]PWE21731.1 hypothetical protein DF188_05825 [Aliarcobacter skirrowii]